MAFLVGFAQLWAAEVDLAFLQRRAGREGIYLRTSV